MARRTIRYQSQATRAQKSQIRSFNHGWVKEWAHAVQKNSLEHKTLGGAPTCAAETADRINVRVVQGEPAPHWHGYRCPRPNNYPSFDTFCQCCGKITPCSLLSMSVLGLLECETGIEAGWGPAGDKLQSYLVS